MKNTFIKLFYKLKDFFPPKASCPTRLSALKTFALIFNTEIITDINGNSFGVLSGEYGDFNYEVNDKTEFEAVNNHIHILDNISKAELGELKDISMDLCKCIQYTLQTKYPDKQFYVYATASEHDSFILRFHQSWNNERPYYSPDFTYEDDLVIILPPNNAKKSN